jgi:ligand-binding SRPBCC domain-containing protein
VAAFEFVARSRLASPAERVWEHASTMEGVNYELAPLLRMTHPPGIDRLDPSLAALGEPAFRSRVLLLGLIPVDYDDLTLVLVDVGRGFTERSSLATQRLWEHERRIEPDGDAACELVDRIRHEPRVPVAARHQSALLRQVFRHRHRRLRRRFGVRPRTPRSRS